MVTCWLPLAEATVETGCMEVLPGLVETGYLRHLAAGGTTIAPEAMPQTAPIPNDCRRSKNAGNFFMIKRLLTALQQRFFRSP